MALALMQARMSSSRLPGKVLRPLLGVPMIGRQIERVRRARRITDLAVATSFLRPSIGAWSLAVMAGAAIAWAPKAPTRAATAMAVK